MEGVGSARRRGKCKWFNVAKGWGFVTPEDGGPDVFVHQSVIRMNGFRSLVEGEVVEFETKDSVKGAEATLVTGPDGSDCQGRSSHQQRRQGTGDSKNKKSRKIRCYNCNELSTHVASSCTMAPQPKRCHQCKSTDHLIADCPLAVPKSKPRAPPEAP